MAKPSASSSTLVPTRPLLFSFLQLLVLLSYPILLLSFCLPLLLLVPISGEVRREDIIVQTKCSARPTAAEFRKVLEESFQTLGLDRVDLLAVHGINREHHLDWVVNNGDKGNCIDVLREYQVLGVHAALGA